MDKECIDEYVRVHIRQRPYSKEINDPNIIQSSVKSFTTTGDCSYYLASQKKNIDFKFAGFLDPSSEQSEVYDTIARPIVDSALLGYSGTIFAYGPTNSGKTHTIRGGDDQELGIMPRQVKCTHRSTVITLGRKINLILYIRMRLVTIATFVS